jgi:glycosyltransferase involved in cell wall biosynthesis
VKSLNVLNISSGDLVGSRFNGYDWHDDLGSLGVETKMLVGWNHDAKKDWVEPLADRRLGSVKRVSDRTLYNLNLRTGSEFSNYPWSLNLFDHPWYKQADVVHLQIIHDGTLDMRSIKRVIDEKPTIWTWHDPWPLTGHCVYPMDCKNWGTGCGNCPDLNRAFTIGKDLTRENRAHKQDIVSKNYVLHVASKWFSDFITSENLSTKPIPDLLPFGLDPKWTIHKNKESARKRLGISKNNFVIGLRSVDEPQKNLELVQNAIQLLPKDINLTVVTIQNFGRFETIRDKFELVELPWSNDNDELSMFYSSLDMFIMPSLWETFGLMALEAMSYGVPVAALQNTATYEVCDIQKNGFTISENTGFALASLILDCIQNLHEVQIQGKKSQFFVAQSRNYQEFLLSLVDLYKKAIVTH